MVLESWTHKIIWRTQRDDKVCPTCAALDGYTWSLGIDEIYPKQLIHPIFGPVFDNRPAADCSIVKEGNGRKCRCFLEHQIDLSGKRCKKQNHKESPAKHQPNLVVEEEIDL